MHYLEKVILFNLKGDYSKFFACLNIYDFYGKFRQATHMIHEIISNIIPSLPAVENCAPLLETSASLAFSYWQVNR